MTAIEQEKARRAAESTRLLPGDRLITQEDPLGNRVVVDRGREAQERRHRIDLGEQLLLARAQELHAAQHDPEARATLLARCQARAAQQDRWYQEDREDSERIAAFAREVKAERQAARQAEERW